MMLMTAMMQQQSLKTNEKKKEKFCVWYKIHMSIFQIVYSKRYLRKLLELFVLWHKIALEYAKVRHVLRSKQRS